MADSARGHGPGHRFVDTLARSYTEEGCEAMVGCIHARQTHLVPYHENHGFHVLAPGAPLDLQLPIGRIRFPANASMRHLVCPLTPQVSYGNGILTGR